MRIEGLGFETQQIQLGLYQDAQTSFTLAEQAEELDEVVVRNQQNENVESEMLGKSSLSLMETKNIPLVLGEQNILKRRPFSLGSLRLEKPLQALMCAEEKRTKILCCSTRLLWSTPITFSVFFRR